MKLILTTIALLFFSSTTYSQITEYHHLENGDSIEDVVYYMPNAFAPGRYDHGYSPYCAIIVNADSFTIEILDSTGNVIFWSNTSDSCWNIDFKDVKNYKTGMVFTCQLTFWTGMDDKNGLQLKRKMFTVRQRITMLI